MQEYRTNKLKTIFEIIQRIENWPEALSLRLRPSRAGLHLLRFRNGPNITVRGGTRDWDIVHELFFMGGYARAFEWLRERRSGTVLDLGGNIGLFSLLAAACSKDLHLVAFEPGPPNFRMFELNRLANENLADRIELRRAAVGGREGKVRWAFDAANPGGSSLYSKGGDQTFEVDIQSFESVVRSIPGPIALVKIDIEGAEYEVLEATPDAVWERIPAVALELHGDPSGKSTHTAFMSRMKQLGYRIEEESVVSFFLHRS